MAIIKPQLPPKSGYIEVEIEGERLYRNIKTNVLLRDEKTLESSETEQLRADVDFVALMTGVVL